MDKCKYCGTREGLVQLEDGGFVCRNCGVKAGFQRCTNCGTFFEPEEGKMRCNFCEEEIYKNDINRYSTKPRTEFKFFKSGKVCAAYYNPPKRRYYGLEMEYSYVNPSELRRMYGNLYDKKFLYNKSDGSLSDGVEVVTAPMDIDTIKKYFIKEICGMFKYIKQKKDTDYSAGVHIHINKNSIPSMDRYKIHTLLNLSCRKDEKRALYFLCGRKSSGDVYFEAGSTESFRYEDNEERHIALNTSPIDTFEFRLFGSTADSDVLLSYIELVDKMLEYSHIYGLAKMTIGNFLIWLKSNTKNEILTKKLADVFKNYKIYNRNIFLCGMDVLNSLKHISYEKYPQIVSYLEANAQRALLWCDINEGLESCFAWDSGEPSTELGKKLLSTYKKVLVHKIMKEVERCA